MKTKFFAAAAVASMIALTGCADMSRQEQGTLGGAVIGGALGNAVFGGTAGTVGGAAVGGLIGHEVTKSAPVYERAPYDRDGYRYDRDGTRYDRDGYRVDSYGRRY